MFIDKSSKKVHAIVGGLGIAFVFWNQLTLYLKED